MVNQMAAMINPGTRVLANAVNEVDVFPPMLPTTSDVVSSVLPRAEPTLGSALGSCEEQSERRRKG